MPLFSVLREIKVLSNKPYHTTWRMTRICKCKIFPQRMSMMKIKHFIDIETNMTIIS